MSRKLFIVVGSVLVLGAVTACGSGGRATVEEVDSGVPPLVPDLQGHLERHFTNANRGTGLRCRQTRTETASLTIWECGATSEPDGRRFEVELLVNGSDGSYEIAECRTGPDQPYSQAPKGACKSIR